MRVYPKPIIFLLYLATARVLDVLLATGCADGVVLGHPLLAAQKLRQKGRAPGRCVLREGRLEGAPVHEGGCRRAAEVGEGGGEVYVERYLVGGPAGGNARSPHGKGHADRLLVGRPLSIGYPVLAQKEAVVRR